MALPILSKVVEIKIFQEFLSWNIFCILTKKYQIFIRSISEK